MTDKQQIEEMKNILLNSKAVTFEPNVQKTYGQYRYDKFFVSNNDGHLTIDYGKFAEALYNAGYRKVDENAVVLTREEFDRLNSCIKSEEEVRAIMKQQMLPMVRELTDKEVGKKLATVTALVRKKTANEFYDKVNENICSFKLENKSQEFIDGYAQAIADICGRLDQVAKQFGVEVE